MMSINGTDRSSRRRAVRTARTEASTEDVRPQRRSAVRREEPEKLSVRSGGESGRPESFLAAGAGEGIDKPKAMLIMLRELRAVIEEENVCLRARRTAELGGLLSRKQSLSRGYLEQMAAVKADPELLQALPPERRAELREAGEALSTAMAENTVLLQANIDVVRSLVGIIVQAVKDQRSESSPAYAESGVMNEEQGDPKARAIALNREF